MNTGTLDEITVKEKYMNKIETLKQFLTKHFLDLDNDGYSGESIMHPPFELSPRDYLQFAELELESTKHNHLSLINCVSHIKRAMDCQIETFFYSYNLYTFFKNKRLGIDKKLEFLRESGVFSSRSLSRLNSIRNKMEHEFEVPKIQDIELYYDLVSAFISILESHILMLEIYAESNWYLKGDDDYLRFSIAFSIKEPIIKASWRSKKENVVELVTNLNEITEFAYFLKAFFLISKTYIHSSKNYIISQINN
ncbi:hypothetical protein [Paenibacillus polymyxa]|uniref:hypothetical protein n=1 Tax=Paenibacillus polymyxa TaxID=1406 RepID=UPI0018AD305C|nr:hypothetical protein [Paenibacillus polymyxa]